MIEQLEQHCRTLQSTVQDHIATIKSRLSPLQTAYVHARRAYRLEDLGQWLLHDTTKANFMCSECHRKHYCLQGNRHAMLCSLYWLGRCETPEITARYVSLMEACADVNGDFRLTDALINQEDFDGLMMLAHIFELNLLILPVVNCLYLRRSLRRLVPPHSLTSGSDERIILESEQRSELEHEHGSF